MFAPDIQAVIFAAGRGSRMTQMIGNMVPKCLLKICGNPLIFYPLKTLANYGLTDVMIVIPDREDVQKEIERIGSRLSLRIEFVVISEEDSEEFGTFQSLRTVMKRSFTKQKKDFLLISCDTITDVSLQKFINFHKTYSSGCTALFVKSFAPTLPTGVKFPGPKNKMKHERDIVGIQPSNNQLVFLASEADFDDQIAIPVEILKVKSPHTKILSSLQDAHIYLIRRDVVEKYIHDKAASEFISIKGEFIPFLINEQLKNVDDHKSSSQMITFPPTADLALYGFMEPEKNCVRVHSVPTYAIACKSVEWLKQTFPNEIETRPKETQIAKTSKLIAAQLGDQSQVAEKVQLKNVISMEGVKFEEGSNVENSIISPYAIVGANAKIRECLVGPGYQVPEGGTFVNEFLTVAEESFFDD